MVNQIEKTDAIKAIKKAKKFAFDQHTTNCLIDAEKRIEDKMSQK